MCSCQLDQFLGVDVSCQVWTLCEAFRKWNCFGDDVIAEQPSHTCLVVYDAVCHVTPCVFLSSEPWLKQGSFHEMLVVFVESFQFYVTFVCSFNSSDIVFMFSIGY